MTTPPKKRKKPGPPRTTGPGEQVVVRLHQPMLSDIDEWCEAQEAKPTRAEALRRLAARGLAVESAEVAKPCSSRPAKGSKT